jgi:hypothetical protein
VISTEEAGTSASDTVYSVQNSPTTDKEGIEK